MKNVTLAVDEKLLEASREYARRHHTTVNKMVRDFLQQEVGQQGKINWVDEFLRLTKEGGGNSRGWKWNREEIYDRKVFR